MAGRALAAHVKAGQGTRYLQVAHGRGWMLLGCSCKVLGAHMVQQKEEEGFLCKGLGLSPLPTGPWGHR